MLAVRLASQHDLVAADFNRSMTDWVKRASDIWPSHSTSPVSRLIVLVTLLVAIARDRR